MWLIWSFGESCRLFIVSLSENAFAFRLKTLIIWLFKDEDCKSIISYVVHVSAQGCSRDVWEWDQGEIETLTIFSRRDGDETVGRLETSGNVSKRDFRDHGSSWTQTSGSPLGKQCKLSGKCNTWLGMCTFKQELENHIFWALGADIPWNTYFPKFENCVGVKPFGSI